MNNPIEENSEESIQSEESDKTSEPENMEVHHHPEIEKKGLRDYLLEGFMIFIAVTLGFFAETIRENVTEHERASLILQASKLIRELKEKYDLVGGQ